MLLKREMGLRQNWWLAQDIPNIPLGALTIEHSVVYTEGGSKKTVRMRFPKKRDRHGKYVQISNTILCVGTTGTGKSVLSKVVEYFLSLERPVIDFDWAGEDSHLSHEPNSLPENLPPYTPPGQIEGWYLHYPVKNSRPKKQFERTVRPNITKYDIVQLEALGFSPGAAMYFQNLIRRYGPFKDWEALYDFIENFPINEAAARAMQKKLEMNKVRIKHTKRYEPNDVINNQSKESIKKVLPGIIEKGVFRLDNREEINFEQAFLAGKNMVFSFNDKDVGRVEINYYMQRIKSIRRQYRESPRYFVKIEEAHKVLAAEGKKVDEVIEEFVLVCRKASVGLLLVMPEATEKTLSDKVLDDIKEIITGKLQGESAYRIGRRCGSRDIANIISRLTLNRYTDEREFLYYSSDDQSWWTFIPFNSPVEIHREVN
mgnify:CR=1 FL=1